MLKRAKILLMKTANWLGFSSLLLESSWRRQRLLILCYHGVSLDDEHLWDPSLYIEKRILRQRFERLRQRRCAVLPFGEAVERLYSGTLPKRSVAITFDDGGYDFYLQALPTLKEFGFPATVYFTTYYSEFNRPVFDPMCGYLLWKGRGRKLVFPEIGEPSTVLDSAGHGAAVSRLKEYARRNGLSGAQKDELLASLADRLKIDYDDLCRRRILHLMNGEEAREVANSGIDIQLHTHRHRVSTEESLFHREIDDNRKRISAITNSPAQHFCYPGGFHLPAFPAWLESCGVRTATTCEPGIVTSGTSPYLMPRLVDTTSLTMTEFDNWLSGLASLLPRRPHQMSEGQLLEGPIS